MNDDNDIAIARMATDLTLAVLANKDHRILFTRESGLALDAGPLAVFDAVYAHLKKTLKAD